MKENSRAQKNANEEYQYRCCWRENSMSEEFCHKLLGSCLCRLGSTAMYSVALINEVTLRKVQQHAAHIMAVYQP